MSIHRTLRIKQDLYLIISFALLLSGIIVIGDNEWLQYLRVVLGLPFLLFFPGYTLIGALFPKKDNLGGIERLVLSFGLSIVVVPLIGLGLNYTPWGLRLASILISLIVFIVIMSGLCLYRRRKLFAEDIYIPRFDFELPAISELAHLDKALPVLLVLSLLFAVGSIGYVVAIPKTGEKFTEFYILGPGGKAEGYPTVMTVGKKAQIILGVVNHEYSTMVYRVYVKMGNNVSIIGPITLNNEQKWENPVEITAVEPYENVKVEFLLYREGDTKPYQSLHFWMTVKAPQGVLILPASANNTSKE